MSSLADRLRERILREGPISFADFMQAALYDPQDGYYARGAAIGEGGDFVTAPSVSPAFAATLARVFSVQAAELEGPIDFVEVGAGGGAFLQELARALRRGDPALAGRLRLTAVETSAAGRVAISERGIEPEPVLLESAEALPERSVNGWIFSNELYDAQPVVRVMGSQQGLQELRVGWEGTRFSWAAVPAASEARAHLEAQGLVLEAGQKAEIAPGAGALHRRLARALARGWLVAFDYGHPARILYHPFARHEGTLAVHTGGRRGGDPLEDPGAHDLTAHVNWDLLLSAGEAEGLHTERLMRQGLFLAEAGIFDLAASDAEKWRIYRLVDPAGMGEEISVLIQSRGVGSSTATI